MTMYRFASAVIIAASCAVTGVAAESRTNFDNTLLALSLKHSYKDGGYTVVSASTSLSAGDHDAKETLLQKKFIAEQLQTNGVNLTPLVDRLFDRNKKPTRLSLKSAPQDGYIVDYEGLYEKYFKKEGGGWEKWYQEHPTAHGSTTVSLPVYDEKNGLVLLYKGTQSHWLAGGGWVILYRYEKGELVELKRVMLWIS